MPLGEPAATRRNVIDVKENPCAFAKQKISLGSRVSICLLTYIDATDEIEIGNNFAIAPM